MKSKLLERQVQKRALPKRDMPISVSQQSQHEAGDSSEQHPVLLSVVMPAFNEANTIEDAIRKLLNIRLGENFELIVVDDGSVDHTAKILRRLMADPLSGRLRVLFQPQNAGKGAAVRRAIKEASGAYLLIFDADSEYDAADISRLVEPLLTGRAEVVYGVRLSGVNVVIPTLSHAIGNRVMTTVANLLYGSWLTDMHTCLKLLPVPLLRAMKLTENGFGLDTEITAEMLRLGYRPYEVPASYVGRTREEGKKIGLLDALRCFYVLGKVRLRGKRKPGLRDRSLAPSVVKGPAGASR